MFISVQFGYLVSKSFVLVPEIEKLVSWPASHFTLPATQPVSKSERSNRQRRKEKIILTFCAKLYIKIVTFKQF